MEAILAALRGGVAGEKTAALAKKSPGKIAERPEHAVRPGHGRGAWKGQERYSGTL